MAVDLIVLLDVHEFTYSHYWHCITGLCYELGIFTQMVVLNRNGKKFVILLVVNAWAWFCGYVGWHVDPHYDC